jgi:hypothetical protein
MGSGQLDLEVFSLGDFTWEAQGSGDFRQIQPFFERHWRQKTIKKTNLKFENCEIEETGEL